MKNSRQYPYVSLDEFLGQIVEGYVRRGDSAAFAAALLGEHDREAAEAIYREEGFNPDEPRDSWGRWTSGGSTVASADDVLPSRPGEPSPGELPPGGADGAPPAEVPPRNGPNGPSPGEPLPNAPGEKPPGPMPPYGNDDNGYNGLGTWGGFKSEKEFIDFLRRLLQPKKNHFPDGWHLMARRGCIGLNMLRIGWGGFKRRPYTPFQYPDAEYYADRRAAEARLRELRRSDGGKKWLFVAAQMPLRVPANELTRQFGHGMADIHLVLRDADSDHASQYNFATWFTCPNGSGYWEYMNHNSETFDPKNSPCVYHKTDLPRSLPGVKTENVITLYGVVSAEPWGTK